MATKLPTKPLFTARFTLLNTTDFTVAYVLKIIGDELKKAGCTIYQSPARSVYTAKYRFETTNEESPIWNDSGEEGPDTEIITTDFIYIAGPAGKEKAQAKARTDPKGSRPILEQKKPVVSAFAWNIGPAKNMTPEQLGALIWKAEMELIRNKDKSTGPGWDPIVTTWEKAPVKLPPYPDRPPIPEVLLPAEPKPKPKPEPKPKPKPEPKPVPVPVPVPVPTPIETKPWYEQWQLWAAIAGVGLTVAIARSDSK